MALFLDGRVSAVLGTHTHVQTADEQILHKGTAFLTDAGMTGPHNSVIGMDKKKVLERFLTKRPVRFEVGKGDIRLQGAIIEIDESSGKAQSIHRVNEAL
jgi:2',3'-cyclic-nucleotide 2'-phosphodiesterase